MSGVTQTSTKRHIVTFDIDASTYAALREIADVYDIYASTLIRAAVRREVSSVSAHGVRAIELVKAAGKAARPVGTHATRRVCRKVRENEGGAA
jgi:S-adenosylmethionine:tRNA-ribosyltransferase-isomerase (queuine synthetase)